MKFARLGCALGRHSIDRNAIRPVHGGQVGRCRHCATPMEEVEPHVWAVLQVHDAGLGPRRLG